MKVDLDLKSEESNFMALISRRCIDFEDVFKVLLKKKAALDRASERFKKAQKELYCYEYEYVDACINVRESISDLANVVEKYENYMCSSIKTEKFNES
jgi:hypothetical protein